MQQTADRPTWNRTKIFGSKGRETQGSDRSPEGAARTEPHRNAPARTGDTTSDTTRRRGRPPVLQVDTDGLLRLWRRSAHAQILLHLSQDETAPTKASQLTGRLALQFSGPTVFNALRDLVDRGFAAKVGYGLYVRRWAPLPGVN